MSEQPIWKHKIPLADARWLYEHSVKAIKYEWRFTSADTSEDWLLVSDEKGNSRKIPCGLWGGDVVFEPRTQGLLSFSRYSHIEEDIQAIDKWQAKEKRDLAEFARLKTKFAGAPVS